MKESSAFAHIYGAHRGRVLRVVGRLAPDDDTAADWAQEAWIRIYNGLPGFQGRSALGTWIHRVALTTAMSLRRTDRRRSRLREKWLDGRVDQQEWTLPPLKHELQQALDTLPPSMRTVLRLHDVEGLRHREIAARLQVAESTSRSQLFEGRLRMRRALTGVNEGRRRSA